MSKETEYTTLFEEYARSGQNAKDFCQQKDISYRTFLRWAQRLHFNIRQKKWFRGQHPASKAQLISTNRQTHSVYSFIRTGIIPCNGCIWRKECEHYSEGESCSIIAEFQSAKMQELMNLEHIKDVDAPLVEIAVREMAIQALIMRHVSNVGLFRATKDGALALQPVMSQYWCSVNALSRILDKLGLSPIARRQLGLGDGGEKGISIVEEYMEK